MKRRQVFIGAAVARWGGRYGARAEKERAHRVHRYRRGVPALLIRRGDASAWLDRGAQSHGGARVTGEDLEQRKAAAAELIATGPDLVVAAGVIAALPVHALTRTIPIVVITGGDLMAVGFADSLARAGRQHNRGYDP